MNSLPKIYGLEDLTATAWKLLRFVINKASQNQTLQVDFPVDELVEAGVYASMDEAEELFGPDVAALNRLSVDTGEFMADALHVDWDDGRGKEADHA